MPELPEVETTRRGLAPHVEGRRIRAVTLRRPDLRWPMPEDLVQVLTGARVTALRRRSASRVPSRPGAATFRACRWYAPISANRLLRN